MPQRLLHVHDVLGRVHWWMTAVAAYLLLVIWHYPTVVNGDYSFPTWNRRHTMEGDGTPNTSSPFLEFVKNETLFLRIEEMTIRIYTEEEGYYNLTVANYSELMDLHSDMNVNKSNPDTLIFWKHYIYNATATFSFDFTFHLEPTSTDQTWYVDSFTHRNHTDSGNCTFEYNGMRRAIYAPSDVSYYCSIMTFHGDCIEGIKSEIQFVGLRIQAFSLQDNKPSSTYIDCGAKSHNNSIINIVVGSVVGSTLGVAVIVIVVTLIVKMVRVRRRGYNLLDN